MFGRLALSSFPPLRCETSRESCCRPLRLAGRFFQVFCCSPGVLVGADCVGLLAVLRSLLHCVHDLAVLLREGHDRFEHVVHLVPHLGGGEVVAGQVGVLAYRPLHAVKLRLIPGGVHEEAHASRQLRLGYTWPVEGPSCTSDREEAEAEDEGFKDEQDEEVGEVEGEHLGGARGPCHKLHCCGNHGSLANHIHLLLSCRSESSNKSL